MLEEHRKRATDDEVEERTHFAAMLRHQGVPPAAVMSRLVTDYGISLRHARRYVASANLLLKEDGLEYEAEGKEDKKDLPFVDPFTETASMALHRLQLQMMEATPSELPRLISALAKLREVMAPGPSLSDAEMINRAGFEGGLAALGSREGPELR